MEHQSGSTPHPRHLRLLIRGAVQGVGFRPFVYRLAREMALTGYVLNSPIGARIEAEGPADALERFAIRLREELPPPAFIQSLESLWLDPAGYSDFAIHPSDAPGSDSLQALVLPDFAPCPDCLRELFDPADRRCRYPFINCTRCGPRFTIIESLPYDRPRTTMKGFTMCEACAAEYHDPRNRRFHAQPNACPRCGPSLTLWDATGRALAEKDDALAEAVAAIQSGRILALKGVGGFHLVLDARNGEAIQRLRQLKNREEKPFALMYPNLKSLKLDCRVSEHEALLLSAPEAPILLLERHHPERSVSGLASGIAPGNPLLGAMLPPTPLHYLLAHDLGFPVVATSGNRSDEPICIDEHEALERLKSMADLFLVHDRPIVRHVDDSIVRVMAGREQVLRRARGYAPLPIPLGQGSTQRTSPVLAVGGQLKNTIALALGDHAFLSQHIGDLETEEARHAFRKAIESLCRLYEAQPELIVHDLHPDYASTIWAKDHSRSLLGVQHHYAHALACMAENELDPPLLAVCWDGTGYGTDATVWGGEFLKITADGFERVAHLRPFPLPGGEQAVREGRRAALGLFYAWQGDALFEDEGVPPLNWFSAAERRVLHRMLERNINSPTTTSAGRLFDAVAALAGLRHVNRFEGQAAMEFEFSIVWDPPSSAGKLAAYPFFLQPGGENQPLMIDWAPMLESLMFDRLQGLGVGKMAIKYHNGLVGMIEAVARQADLEAVVLSGGCFLNRYLLERCVERLTAAGFRPYWHQRVPPGDGGIALGQILAARRHPTS